MFNMGLREYLRKTSATIRKVSYLYEFIEHRTEYNLCLCGTPDNTDQSWKGQGQYKSL